jgi:hypothetical protein
MRLFGLRGRTLMRKSFRRIALAQGLLPHDAASGDPTRWTDKELKALLQIDEAPERVDLVPCDRGMPRCSSPAVGTHAH